MRVIIKKDYSGIVHNLIDEDNYLDIKFNNAFLRGNNKEMKWCIRNMFKDHNKNAYSLSLDSIVRQIITYDNSHILKYIHNHYSNCVYKSSDILFRGMLDICILYNAKKCLHFLLDRGYQFDDIDKLIKSTLICPYYEYYKNSLTLFIRGNTVRISLRYILQTINNFNVKFMKELFRVCKDYYDINAHDHIYLRTALHINVPLNISRGTDNDDIIQRYPFYRLGYHVNYLVELGANYRFNYDYPLRISCAKGHLALTTYFLSLGCDHTLKNWWAWRMAVKNNHLHIICELELYNNNKKGKHLIIPYNMIIKYISRKNNEKYESMYNYLQKQNRKQQDRVSSILTKTVSSLYKDVIGIIVGYL